MARLNSGGENGDIHPIVAHINKTKTLGGCILNGSSFEFEPCPLKSVLAQAVQMASHGTFRQENDSRACCPVLDNVVQCGGGWTLVT